MCGARHPYSVVFFFNDTATTEIYTLSLHDALPILYYLGIILAIEMDARRHETHTVAITTQSPWKLLLRFGYHFSSDRNSTRLNSSHANISYAVFCLKKKK